MNFVIKLKKCIEDYQQYRATVHLLQALSDKELNDLGINRQDIPNIIKYRLNDNKE